MSSFQIPDEKVKFQFNHLFLYLKNPRHFISEDSFFANCPVADRRDSSTKSLRRAFASECGDDGECVEDIQIEANFMPPDDRWEWHDM